MKRKILIGLVGTGVALFCCWVMAMAQSCGLIAPPRAMPTSTPISATATSTIAVMPSPTDTSLPATPSPVPSTPTFVPSPVPFTPTPISPTTTPTPGADERDIAYLFALVDVLSRYDEMTHLLENTSEASLAGDIVRLCALADDLVLLGTDLVAMLNNLPPPNHPYLVKAHDHKIMAMARLGAAGMFIQAFCDGSEPDGLELATDLIEEANEEILASVEWLNKYGEENP